MRAVAVFLAVLAASAFALADEDERVPIEVRVVDAATDAPIAGAEVEVEPTVEEAFLLLGTGVVLTEGTSGRTGPQGTTIVSIPADRTATIAVTARGYRDASVAVSPSAVSVVARLVVASAGALEGRLVRKGGAPASAGIVLRVLRADDNARVTATTDATGRFRLDGVRPGSAVYLHVDSGTDEVLVDPGPYRVRAGETRQVGDLELESE
jgi:hypothetical protein